MIKLLALDIDDTLTDDTGKIIEAGIIALREAQSNGMQVVLASARPPQGVDSIARLLPMGVYKICYVGAVIQDKNSKDIQRLLIDIDVARDIARFADQHTISLTITIDDVEYQTHHEARDSSTPRVVVGLAEPILSAGTAPLIINVTGHRAAQLLYEYCAIHHHKSISLARHFNSDGTYASALITHPIAQKGPALQTLCRLLSIEPKEIMAIGDSNSDVSMFQVAGLSVAVANAHPDVQHIATYVAPLPYGDGVAWALKQLISEQK